MLTIDKRAGQTLTRTFWGAGGWKRPRDEQPAADVAAAVAAGYMFEAAASIHHDELVARAIELGNRLSIEDASDAFVASLSTRWLFLRPFLPSLVVAKSLPIHKFEPASGSGAGPARCAVCDTFSRPHVEIDRNVLNFERHKWGGVRHLDIAFVWFCLDRLEVEGAATPTPDDIQLMQDLLASLDGCSAEMSLTQAEACSLPKSNKQERHALLESLSTVSVLEDPQHPGFLRHFQRTFERELPGRRFLDRGFPGEWWRGSHGVNWSAVRALFPRVPV